MKKTTLIILTILSAILAGCGVCNIPILSAFGVNVFAHRGLLLILFIPITFVCCIPLAICLNKLFPKKIKSKTKD